jgi:hypothetical protein
MNYLTAPDAAEFVKPMLSAGGEIKHNNKTEAFNISDSTPTGKDDFALAATLVVIDFEENIRAVEQLLVEGGAQGVDVDRPHHEPGIGRFVEQRAGQRRREEQLVVVAEPDGEGAS